MSQDADEIGRIEDESDGGGPLQSGEAGEVDAGLQKIYEKTPGEVGKHEDAEAVAFREFRRGGFREREREGEHRDGFVELDGMPTDTVTEIDRPRDIAGQAV